MIPNNHLPKGRKNAQYYRFNKQVSPRILPNQAKITQIDIIQKSHEQDTLSKKGVRSKSTIYERLKRMNISEHVNPRALPSVFAPPSNTLEDSMTSAGKNDTISTLYKNDKESYLLNKDKSVLAEPKQKVQK